MPTNNHYVISEDRVYIYIYVSMEMELKLKKHSEW